jgi:hypothetical protein
MSGVQGSVHPMLGVANSRVRKPTNLKTVEGDAALHAVKTAAGANALPSAWAAAEKSAKNSRAKPINNLESTT